MCNHNSKKVYSEKAQDPQGLISAPVYYDIMCVLLTVSVFSVNTGIL